MPRYVIGNVEIPVNQATAANAVANPAALAVVAQGANQKEALKERNRAAGGGGGGLGVSGGSLLVVGGLVAAAGWFLFKHKPSAKAKATPSS